ncbi:MAG: HNH endonuclease [Nanoarchaeota archaeon]|nr:HNH endonuclease [Nanoarchaeota archaeon]
MKEHHSFKGKTYEEFYGIEKAKQIKEKMSKKKKGRKSWNKNLKGEELKKHYKNGFKGTFKKGEDNINFGRETPTIKGEKHWNWKGGITPENHGIRDSLQIRKWRKKVFERDNYICQICGKRGYCLHAHHIKSFVNFPELRFVLDNGQTLCKECHLTIHTHNN